MYKIVRRLDGTYYCTGVLQDGNEEWVSDTLAKAISDMRLFARTMNNDKNLRVSRIAFMEEVKQNKKLTVQVLTTAYELRKRGLK